MALAQWAGQTVAAAAVTDVWEAARHKFARLSGPRRSEEGPRRRSGGWRRHTSSSPRRQGAELEPARAAQAQRWEGRFADLLDEDPGVEADLRALVEEIRAQLPAGAVSAADHSVAAGRDVNITASGGGVAAGVIHGDVSAGNPPSPGPGKGEPGPGPR